jgi:hypothetical protein
VAPAGTVTIASADKLDTDTSGVKVNGALGTPFITILDETAIAAVKLTL